MNWETLQVVVAIALTSAYVVAGVCVATPRAAAKWPQGPVAHARTFFSCYLAWPVVLCVERCRAESIHRVGGQA